MNEVVCVSVCVCVDFVVVLISKCGGDIGRQLWASEKKDTGDWVRKTEPSSQGKDEIQGSSSIIDCIISCCVQLLIPNFQLQPSIK